MPALHLMGPEGYLMGWTLQAELLMGGITPKCFILKQEFPGPLESAKCGWQGSGPWGRLEQPFS